MRDFHRPFRSYTLALTNAASTSSTSTSRLGTHFLRLVPTVNCWVDVDKDATVGTSILVPAWVPLMLQVTPNATVTARCDSATTGSLNITEMNA